jgi:hypothetical protein
MSKANFFSLITEFSRDEKYATLDPVSVRTKLREFEAKLPEDYVLAAREAVSRKGQRELRARFIKKILLEK